MRNGKDNEETHRKLHRKSIWGIKDEFTCVTHGELEAHSSAPE